VKTGITPPRPVRSTGKYVKEADGEIILDLADHGRLWLRGV